MSHQPGDFLRIYNLRAIPGSSKVPGLTSSQSEEVDHLAFHLHGGTSYGRGLQALPENSADVQQLKTYDRSVTIEEGVFLCSRIRRTRLCVRSVIEAFAQDDELNDSALLEICSTPPESPLGKDRCFSQIFW